MSIRAILWGGMAALAVGSTAFAAPVRSIVAADGEEYEVVYNGPSCRDYVQDGLVLCLDAIENVAMGVSDHTEPYVFNIARGGDYYRLDQITFNEETKSFDRPYVAGILSKSDSFCAPFRNLSVTAEYCAEDEITGTYGNGWGCGCNPTTNGWSYIFYSLRNNYLRVSGTGQRPSDIISPTDSTHSTIVIDGKTMYSYCYGEYDKQRAFTSEGYQYCNYFAFGTVVRYNFSPITKFHCFRLYNRPLTEEEIAWNYAVDLARFGEEDGNE